MTRYCKQLIIPELKDKFLKVKDLLKEQVKNDKEKEPHKSKYEARDFLFMMEPLINDQISKEPLNDYLKDLLAVVFCMIGNISYDVEEQASGKEYTQKAIDLISDPIHPSRITCIMTSLNNLGFYTCQAENFAEAQALLERSESLYKQYNDEINEPATEFETLFTGEIKFVSENIFGKCYTQTLFYLAQVYSKTDNPAKSAKYCHTTLRRQLEAGDEEPVEWALNAATLSQYLIEQSAFKEAKHHLAASLMILQRQGVKMDELILEDSENEELLAKKETINYRLADVYRCWAKYSIFLLNISKERLVSSEGDSVDPVPEPPGSLLGLEFPTLKAEVQDIENSVTHDFILTYEDAIPLFQKSMAWLNDAKNYYSLDHHASEYAAIAQDSSRLYHLLSFFQSDETIQCKYHKRRIDTLITVVTLLNPTYYMKVCREMWYEIGETCMTMADIKATQVKESKKSFSEKEKEHNASKIKQLLKKGILYLNDFVKSFKLKSKDEKYPEGFEKQVILAYMYLGHMYAKVNETDKNLMVHMQEESLRCYKTLLDYYTVNSDARKLYAEEFAICQEMSQLLPIKISRMKSLFKIT